MVLTDLNNSSIFKIERRTHQPSNFVTDIFEGQDYDDISYYDVIDNIDPETSEVLGKKAVFNQTSYDDKVAAQAAADSAQATSDAAMAVIDAEIRAADIDSMDHDSLKDLVKKMRDCLFQ